MRPPSCASPSFQTRRKRVRMPPGSLFQTSARDGWAVNGSPSSSETRMLMSTRVHGLAGGRSLLAGIATLALLGLVSGCKEEFSDERFGVLDLASTYDG